jgi:hypothetical protein
MTDFKSVAKNDIDNISIDIDIISCFNEHSSPNAAKDGDGTAKELR